MATSLAFTYISTVLYESGAQKTYIYGDIPLNLPQPWQAGFSLFLEQWGIGWGMGLAQNLASERSDAKQNIIIFRLFLQRQSYYKIC